MWYENELVPRLLDDPKELPGGWIQVVMAFLPPIITESQGWLPMHWLLQSEQDQALYAPAQLRLDSEGQKEMISLAIDLLRKAHSMPVVYRSGNPLYAAHGDARPGNFAVLVENRRASRVLLLDLDWAGLEGECLYPPLMNVVDVHWPAGAAPGEPLRREHDLLLLDAEVRSALQSGWHGHHSPFPVASDAVPMVV